MAATDVPKVSGVPAGLDIDVNLHNLATFGTNLQAAATTFGSELGDAAAVNFGGIAPDASFAEMVHFRTEVTKDVGELTKYTTAMMDGLMSYSAAAIASFNKYGWGDDQARLSLQDVRDAMRGEPRDASGATASPPPNATAD